MTEYVELHARSAFSFLEGASLPEEMAAVCAEFGMSTMALLDNNGVYGIARLHMGMKRLGLRGLVGAEVQVEEFGCAPFAHRQESYPGNCKTGNRWGPRIRRAQIPRGVRRGGLGRTILWLFTEAVVIE